MAYKDLREFIQALDNNGELGHVKVPVDWRYELAGWIRKTVDLRPVGPALMFENIKDYPGSRLFSAGLASHSRIALAIGMDPKTSHKELVNEFIQRLKKPIPTKLVATGPVKENIITGDDIDLYKFPVPWWNPLDGGRYIGTWHGCVTKNPQTGIQNSGAYRMQVLNSKQTAVGFMPFSHMGDHFAQCRRSGEDMEMAMVMGADETVNIVSAMGVSPFTSEFTLAGALRQEAIEMVKCETIDLEVPANAEIVVEGLVRYNENTIEGPFGEYQGYHGGGVRVRPIFQVTAITHRNNPIFRGCVLGKPPTEHHVVMDILISSASMARFQESGPEGVLAVHCPPAANSCSMAVVQMRPRYVGHSRNVGRALISLGQKSMKYVVVVDEDIDIYNLGQVWWAIVTRTQGSRDFEVLPFCPISRSDPSIPHDRGEFTDKMIIDATKKLDYPYNAVYGGHWAPVCLPPDEVMNLVETKWEQVFGKTTEPNLDAKIKDLTELLEGKFQHWAEWRDKAYQISEEQKEKETTLSIPKF